MFKTECSSGSRAHYCSTHTTMFMHSLTPTISNIVEGFIMSDHIKTAVIKKFDSSQFGSIVNSTTITAIISMLQKWYGDTDGTGSCSHTTMGRILTSSIIPFQLANCNSWIFLIVSFTGLSTFYLEDIKKADLIIALEYRRSLFSNSHQRKAN